MVSIEKGSDNIFTDRGFDDAEVQSLQRKADAIIASEPAMKAHHMSRAAAKIMNVSRAPESDVPWKSEKRPLRSNPADGRPDRREGEVDLHTASSQSTQLLATPPNEVVGASLDVKVAHRAL
jgi:hypothetical protein